MALNYGYGVLYGEVERACVLAGLDPYGGFLHVDRPGKLSLAFDLIEPFRPAVVDRAMLAMVVKGTALQLDEGGRLDSDTRITIVNKVHDRLACAGAVMRASALSLGAILQTQARELAVFLTRRSGRHSLPDAGGAGNDAVPADLRHPQRPGPLAKWRTFAWIMGLDRLQYSAFVGRLARGQQEELLLKVKKKMGKRAGNVQIIPIASNDWASQIDSCGRDGARGSHGGGGVKERGKGIQNARQKRRYELAVLPLLISNSGPIAHVWYSIHTACRDCAH